MMKRINAKIMAAAILLSMTTTTASFANSYGQLEPIQQQYQPTSYAPPLQGHVVVIPQGTNIPSVATTEISTENLTVGSPVYLSLNQPFYYNGIMIAPAGSQIAGNAIVVQKAGLAGKYGKLKILFTNIITPQGYSIPISGRIATEDGSGLLVGGTTKERVKDTAKDLAIGSAAGALLGTVIAPMSHGSVGRGAAMGTALGAGLGLGKTVIDKGQNVVISSGDSLQVTLDQPVSINPTNR